MPSIDFFHMVKAPSPALPHANYTADETGAPVIDLRDEKPGTVVSFLVIATAQTTLDANNYFDVELWESSEKASATALDANASLVADTGREGHDVLGLTEDATLLNATTMATFPFPRLNAAAQVGKVYFFQYRGYLPCVQLRLYARGTGGSPDADVLALAVMTSGDTENIKDPVIS